ncbi:AAA family ATPase [Caballeronia sp. 15715]|uniref:AAA family ATPase n=1 Tax=Caballeronia sp. 15715 TaxID=3391030 RepID=UPI0039E5DECC
MATAKQDFERFVAWLYQPEREIPPDVRRLALLCLRDFNAIAEKTRQRSARSVYLVDIARRSLHSVVDEAPVAAVEENDDAWSWNKLRTFTLGPFRGFRVSESFDLAKQYVLFYGPNGSGKTSVCEGLEHALLGAVEEAESKRIAPRTYFTNLHARRFVPPVLTAVDNEGREINVTPNADMYRFCFIEKNRIDSFSRLAARSPTQRAELIATLFGMDQFNDFVGNFNENIDNQLKLTNVKQTALATQKATLANDLTLVQGEEDVTKAITVAESNLGLEFAEGMTFNGLKTLIGSDEAPGRLHVLDAILDKVLPSVVGVTRKGLVNALDTTNAKQAVVTEAAESLRTRSEQVSFKKLYDAVLFLQASVGDRCPACDTPLTGEIQVVRNPYEKATSGLEGLKELALLQSTLTQAQNGADDASRALHQLVGLVSKHLSAQAAKPVQLITVLEKIPAQPFAKWHEVLAAKQVEREGYDVLAELLLVADSIETFDKANQQAQQERQANSNERRRLNEFQLKVQAQDLKRQQAQDGITQAKARIAAFSAANAELIAQANQERAEIERDTPLQQVYNRFLEELKAYRDQLPGAAYGRPK